MPGLIAFRRRWSVGSDDLVGPAILICIMNCCWIVCLTSLILYAHIDPTIDHACEPSFNRYLVGTIGILCMAFACDAAIARVSARGGVFDENPRAFMGHLLYFRLALLVLETLWLCVGIYWTVNINHTHECSQKDFMFKSLIAVVVTNFGVVLSQFVAIAACFDSAGRTFARIKDIVAGYENPTNTTSRLITQSLPFVRNISLSGDQEYKILVSKLKIQYKEKWRDRVQGCLCAGDSKPTEQAAFSDVALLFATMFEDLDLVLSDFIAGMILLRRQQILKISQIVAQDTNDVHQYLSGAPISPRTKFVAVKDEDFLPDYKRLVHFAQYVVASYGWQGQCFFYQHRKVSLRTCASRCSSCCAEDDGRGHLLGDYCCNCQYAYITQSANIDDEDFVYGNYENESQVPSYFVCLDHTYRSVVLCIRGTMSFSDVLIDLQADAEEITVNPRQPTWMGHKGMVLASLNVLKELMDNKILDQAFSKAPTNDYTLRIIGHSLGAGVAAILAFLLRESYPSLYCYSYSPPGGLLSSAAMEVSKSFITAVMLGKDVVPRLGLAQLEFFRSDILQLLKSSPIPKYKVLSSSLPLLRCCFSLPAAEVTLERSRGYNPFLPKSASASYLSMYLPGRVLHIVKNYPQGVKSKKPLYQAIWADNDAFDTILVSPSMVVDHMPTSVLHALQQLQNSNAPKKPIKLLTEDERQALLLNSETESSKGAQSPVSGLSWEYTCVSEAAVALHLPVNERSTIVSSDRALTPSKWEPLPLASQEDIHSLLLRNPSVVSSHNTRDKDAEQGNNKYSEAQTI